MLDGIKKAIFFGAHTDDEFIAAGTLHRLARQGCEVHVVTFGPAATKEDRQGSHPSVRVVLPEWHAALDLIGVGQEHRHFRNFVPSSKLATEYAQEIADTIFQVVENVKPDCVFTLSPDDENTAHAVVGRESERVLRGRVPLAVRCNFAWNYTIGRPNLFVRLSEENLNAKRRVIDCYASQHWRYAYKEMLLAATTLDGLSVKVPAAEKFEILRLVT